MYGVYKALGHHPDYWYWILRGRPARSPHLLKQKTVREYGEKYGLKTLVETGTYYGEMVAAMKGRFDRIYSIEYVAELANRARKKFARCCRRGLATSFSTGCAGGASNIDSISASTSNPIPSAAS